MAKDVGVHGGMSDRGRSLGSALFHAIMSLGGVIVGAIAVYADAQWSKDGIDLFIQDPMFSWAVTLLYNTFGQFVVSSMLASPEFSNKLSPMMRKTLRAGIIGSYVFDASTNMVTFYKMLAVSAKMTEMSWWVTALVVIPVFSVLITFSEWVLSLCFQYLISTVALLFDFLDDGQANGSVKGSPAEKPVQQPVQQPPMQQDDQQLRAKIKERMAQAALSSQNNGAGRDEDGLIKPKFTR